MARILPKDAKLIPDDAECVFRGIIYDVYQWDQELYDGSSARFEKLRRPDTVVIIAIDGSKLFYVEEQQPPDVSRTNFPSGRVDKDESWEDAAKREGREELRVTFKNWRLLNVVQPLEKIEWFVAYYVAWDIDKSDVKSHQAEAGEKITVKSDEYENVMKVIRENPKSYQPTFLDDIGNTEELKEISQFQG